MAYSEVGDLLLGDMVLGPTVNKQQFVDSAADDMNGKLGVIYKLPLQTTESVSPDGDSWKTDPGALPEYQQLLLKGCNNKMASGRLILTLDTAGEQTTLHAYGKSLIDEAMAELYCLANGDVDLSAVKTDVAPVTGGKKTPGIKQYDEESLLLGFETNVMGVERPFSKWYTRPGQVSN